MTHYFHSSLRILVSASVNLLPQRVAQRHPELSIHVRRQMWNSSHRVLLWAAMPCLHCTQHSLQPFSPSSAEFTVTTVSLEDFQQTGSPPSSHLLCSCLSLIFFGRYLRQDHPPQQPSGKMKGTQQPKHTEVLCIHKRGKD